MVDKYPIPQVEYVWLVHTVGMYPDFEDHKVQFPEPGVITVKKHTVAEDGIARVPMGVMGGI